MMNSISINERFADVPGLKTAKGAQARLDKFTSQLEDGRELQLHTLVMQKEDGTFIPVAFPTRNYHWLTCALIHNNICSLVA